MRITAISDTHGLHSQLKLPGGDLLIHAGDCGENKGDTRNFLHWLNGQDYKLKIFIAGNHDRYIEDRFEDFLGYVNHYKSIKYLHNDSIEFEGLKVWGSPYSRNLPRWAFQLSDENAESVWTTIPDDTSIVITHGPAYGYGDRLLFPRPGEDPHCGCPQLAARVVELNPIFHIFGHIHEEYGVTEDGITRFVNASVVDINYNVVNEPINFEL